MEDEVRIPRRSPRFAQQNSEEKFTTPPTTPESTMDLVNDQMEASQANVKTTMQESTCTFTPGNEVHTKAGIVAASTTVATPSQGNMNLIYTAASTNVITSSQENMPLIHNAPTPTATPDQHQQLVSSMQMKIEELERKLKNSMELQYYHQNLSGNNMLRNHQSASQYASTTPHATACQQRPFGFREFELSTNGNAVVSTSVFQGGNIENQLYRPNAIGNFNPNVSNHSNVSGNYQYASGNVGFANNVTNPIGNSNQTEINENLQSRAQTVIDFGRNNLIPRKLQDLPQFSGEPELWPMFSVSYTQSTSEYGYTNFENCQRLQKSLKGTAFETVKSLLIHPNNVSAVMEQLEFRFGRPEQLVASQLKEIGEVSPISESAVDKIILYATKVKNLSVFLQSAGAYQHLSNPTLIGELISKLPMSKKIEWARYAAPIKPYPTVIDFSNWINEAANILCTICEIKPDQPDPKRKTVLHTNVSLEMNNNGCFVCGKDHRIYKCELFLEKNVDDRWSEVKRLKLCFSCLGKGHSSYECKAKRECSYPGCKRIHNRLLHQIRDPALQPAEVPKSNQAVLNCTTKNKISKVYFKIVPITLYGPNITISTYAIVDDAAAVSLMNKSLMTKLGLKGESSTLDLQWLWEGYAEEATTIVNVMVSGRDKDQKYLLKGVHAVNDLNLPVQSLELGDLGKLDPVVHTLPISEYSNARPEVFIGLNNACLGAVTESIELHSDGLYATNTKLGWIVYGSTNDRKRQTATCLHVRTTGEQSLDEMATDYFSTESFGVRPAPIVENENDVRARNILKSTTQYVGGRFQTGLLWKEDNIQLPDSLPMATKRLTNIEKKMCRDTEFAAKYKNAINNYIEKGYARKLTPVEAKEFKPTTWYLPHFAVVNPNKPKKLRLVFDAAATVNDVSLNSFLLKGPQEYQPLPSVLFNFRVGTVAVCADIREMFHQILIRPEDRCAQRFLWRDGQQDRPPEVYEMVAMTFGAACSPCSAQYVKVENAKKHVQHDPRAVRAILENHYVDDYVDSFRSVEDAIHISRQVKEIHSNAGFELCGFISNSNEVARALNGNQEAKKVVDGEALSTEKVLGMYWYPKNDTFRFHLKFNRVDQEVVDGLRVPTKRELLSIIMSVFDPLGLLGHLMITAKLIMREVWRCNVQWDEILPEYVNDAWLKWKKDLHEVTKIEIPRNYFVYKCPGRLELHVFVDASESAFAAVAYWRFISSSDEVGVSFVCSKSRCAPLKQLSVPRMELQAAVLGVRLMQTIQQEHQLEIGDCTLWSDSSTVIKWIQSTNRRYKQFVAHRINEILNATNIRNWKWVPTQYNVADEATRLRHNIDISSDSRWFTGPQFLKEDPQFWPKNVGLIQPSEDDEVEVVGDFLLLTVETKLIDIKRFSSFLKLKRTIAWVVRFIEIKCKGRHYEDNALSMDELTNAENIVVRCAQLQSFSEDIQRIEKKGFLPKESPLHKLMPYKDTNGILRVNSRLNAATWLPYDIKHPIILSSDHELTFLIVRCYHEKMMHQNHEATISEIRQRFWIPRIRQVLKRVIGKCTKCKINNAKPVTPIMGPLPEDRLTPYVRPFTYTGLDYFGPVYVTNGRRQEKRWVALFTCLTVRAVHLEIAYDLSTDACILAIRNFMNRRGTPVRIRSDNGKNFVGLEGDAKQFSEVFDCGRVKDELSSKNIQWVFNCPLNPSEGGIWERMVQSVKRVLKQTMHSVAPREHTFQSFLIEAENVVNSRPLTHVPVSSYDEDPITPNHFLLGVANTAQTPSIEAIDSQPKVLRKQWRISRQLRDHFWKRWIAEYLPTLTRREKWCKSSQALKVDDLVLVCDVNVPRREWQKGRVQKVIPGKDDVIRRAEVRTSHGVLNRPVSKLAIIDVVCGEHD